jgi:hypothetical protein
MKHLLIATFAIPILAVTASAQLNSQPQRAQAIQRQRAESRMRIMRVVGLADALGLDEAQALRISEAMRPFDARRAALETQNAESAKIIKRAADGEASAAAQLDQSLQRIWDNRVEIQQLNRDMFEAAGRELSPQQRAKMAIFFATFANEVRTMQQRAQERARQDALKAAAEHASDNAPR